MAQGITSFVPNLGSVPSTTQFGTANTTPAATTQRVTNPFTLNTIGSTYTANPITSQTPHTFTPPVTPISTYTPTPTVNTAPSATVSVPTTTTPQIPTIDLTGFSTASLRAFQNAANLGGGVQTNMGLIGGPTHATGNIPQPTSTVTTPATPTTAPVTATVTPTNTQTQPQVQGTVTPEAANFGGLVGAVRNAANSAITNPIVQQAQQKYMQNAQSIGERLAQISNQPGLAGANQAEVSNLINAYNTEQNALANTIQQGLLPTQTQISGLNNAATLAQPSGTFPFVFNPVTGQFSTATGGNIGGLSGNFNNDISNMTSAVMSGKIGIDQATNALSSMYGDTAKGGLYTAITNAGGNPTALQAQASALQTTIQTGGTSQAQAYNTINQNAQNAAAGFATARNNINVQANNVVALMNNTPGINPTDARFLNTPINELSTQFNSPAYANLNAQISSLQRAVSAYLQAGEIPSTATESATNIINGSMTVGALSGAIQGIDNDLGAAIQSQNITSQNAIQNMQSLASSSNQSSGQTNSSNIISTPYGDINPNL